MWEAAIGCLVGMIIGGKAVHWQWRRNADIYQRIYSKGKLYKVIHDEFYDCEILERYQAFLPGNFEPDPELEPGYPPKVLRS